MEKTKTPEELIRVLEDARKNQEDAPSTKHLAEIAEGIIHNGCQGLVSGEQLHFLLQQLLPKNSANGTSIENCAQYAVAEYFVKDYPIEKYLKQKNKYANFRDKELSDLFAIAVQCSAMSGAINYAHNVLVEIWMRGGQSLRSVPGTYIYNYIRQMMPLQSSPKKFRQITWDVIGILVPFALADPDTIET